MVCVLFASPGLEARAWEIRQRQGGWVMFRSVPSQPIAEATCLVPAEAIDSGTQLVAVNVVLDIDPFGIYTVALSVELNDLLKEIPQAAGRRARERLRCWLIRRAWTQVMTTSPGFERASLLHADVYWYFWNSGHVVPLLTAVSPP